MKYLILTPTLAFDGVAVSHILQLNCHKKEENVLIRIYVRTGRIDGKCKKTTMRKVGISRTVI